jgi:hypothetical protein
MKTFAQLLKDLESSPADPEALAFTVSSARDLERLRLYVYRKAWGVGADVPLDLVQTRGTVH